MGADHVHAHEAQAPADQLGPHGRGNFPIPIGQGPGFASTASGEVAPTFPGSGNSRQGVGHGLAFDHENALIPVLDFREIALSHDLLRSPGGEGLDHHGQV